MLLGSHISPSSDTYLHLITRYCAVHLFGQADILVPVICIIVFAAAIIASPFGILFSNEPSPGAMPLNVAIGQLNMELSNTLEALQDDSYSSIDIQGQDPDWREVLAVFSAKTAGAVDGLDVAVLTPDRVYHFEPLK